MAQAQIKLLLAGSWSAREFGGCLQQLDAIYTTALVLEALSDLNGLSAETKDEVDRIDARAQISNLNLLLSSGSLLKMASNAPDSRELIPYKKAEVAKVEQENGKGGYLTIEGTEKAISKTRKILNALLNFLDPTRPEKGNQARLKTIQGISDMLDEQGVPLETRQQIILELMDESGFLPKAIKQGKIKFDNGDE